MKKKIISIALVVSVLAVAAVGTLAYFTDEKTAHNEITMGNVGIVLHETDGEGNPFQDPVDVMPGDDIKKIVTVENPEGSAVWVRVFIFPTLFDAEGNPMAIPEGLITPDCVPDTWEYDPVTGAWYYPDPLGTGETTGPVLTDVKFDLLLGNEYMNANLKIDVYAQAVQYENNGDTVMEAVGWPEPPTP